MFKVPVNISARHVHLCEKDAEILFGYRYKINKMVNLMQPGFWAAKETIGIIGPKGKIDKVRVLGPYRHRTQVEISLTDAYKIGLTPPIRNSGDLEKSAPITLCVGEKKLELSQGCIIAKAHIHMSEKDAKEHNLKDGQKVHVKLNGVRPLDIEVICRCNKDGLCECHIDTDEANAAGIFGKGYGFIEEDKEF